MAREDGEVTRTQCMNNNVNIVFDADGMKEIWRKWLVLGLGAPLSHC